MKSVFDHNFSYFEVVTWSFEQATICLLRGQNYYVDTCQSRSFHKLTLGSQSIVKISSGETSLSKCSVIF